MTEVKMERSVKKEAKSHVEVVDATKGDAKNRDPELDALMKYLSELSETVETEGRY